LLLVAVIVSNEPVMAADDTIIVSRIRRVPVESKALAAVGYSKRLRALEIEFRNGAIYRYLDVPRPIHNELLSAPSKARFYHEKIRGKYRALHVRQPAK
jgi:lysyl-tRNA synthetase class 2